ncbi:MAG TPA: PQQ-dependent sugar dehydrogenase [Tepidisphaeraceae bacterium]
MSGLSTPTGFAFAGPSTSQLFAIEKNTGLVKFKSGAAVTTALDLNVNTVSERGLLGIAVPPTFSTDTTKYVYLYYSANATAGDSSVDANWAGNKLSRFVWNGSTLSSEQNLFTIAPTSAGNGPNHDAGPITFGPDGKLYGTLGDLNRNLAEQNNQTAANTSSQVGGIYRLNPDGSIPADNPFANNANPDFRKFYAYGVRNTFGFQFDARTNRLWDTENGPNTYDEINLVAPGFNSGWNKIMGPDSRDPQNAPADLVVLPGSIYSDPEFSWNTTVAPTGLEFLGAAGNDPAYRDLLIVADNNTGQLWKFTLNASRDGFVLPGNLADLVLDSGDSTSGLIFGSGFFASQLDVGPDGALYVASLSTGTIYRIAGVPEPSFLTMLAVLLLFPRRR